MTIYEKFVDWLNNGPQNAAPVKEKLGGIKEELGCIKELSLPVPVPVTSLDTLKIGYDREQHRLNYSFGCLGRKELDHLTSMGLGKYQLIGADIGVARGHFTVQGLMSAGKMELLLETSAFNNFAKEAVPSQFFTPSLLGNSGFLDPTSEDIRSKRLKDYEEKMLRAEMTEKSKIEKSKIAKIKLQDLIKIEDPLKD